MDSLDQNGQEIGQSMVKVLLVLHEDSGKVRESGFCFELLDCCYHCTENVYIDIYRSESFSGLDTMSVCR